MSGPGDSDFPAEKTAEEKDDNLVPLVDVCSEYMSEQVDPNFPVEKITEEKDDNLVLIVDPCSESQKHSSEGDDTLETIQLEECETKEECTVTLHSESIEDKMQLDMSNSFSDKVLENTMECVAEESNNILSNDLFKFNRVPIQITGAWKEFDSIENYTKGCKWAPDGSCIMTCSNDNGLRLFNFPSELWQPDFSWKDINEMFPVLHIQEGGSIYDYVWYPNMNSNDADTCCFCSTSQNSPIHMWDAFTGELRCSYRPYNHVDEVTTPYSVAFDCSGDRIFCGFKKIVRIFSVSVPGRSCEERPTYVKKSGQAGIISCFAFCPQQPNISAAGSYNRSIGIYSEPSGFLEHLLVGQTGGVTHLKFSPDGTKLFSGARKDLEILCWDMRNLSSALFSLRRLCVTNQRLYFDVSGCGKYLVSGNHNGVVTIWDMSKAPTELPNSSYPVLEPEHFYQAHDDCVNGASFHPNLPVIATCSGQRQFPDPTESDDEDEERTKKPMFTHKNIKSDNSLRLWWTSDF